MAIPKPYDSSDLRRHRFIEESSPRKQKQGNYTNIPEHQVHLIINGENSTGMIFREKCSISGNDRRTTNLVISESFNDMFPGLVDIHKTPGVIDELLDNAYKYRIPRTIINVDGYRDKESRSLCLGVTTISHPTDAELVKNRIDAGNNGVQDLTAIGDGRSGSQLGLGQILSSTEKTTVEISNISRRGRILIKNVSLSVMVIL